MKFPDRKDFLDYAEGHPLSDPEVQRQVLKMLASSRLYREQMAELKKDLYLVDVQVPEYVLSASYVSKLAKLSQSWIELQFARDYGFKGFYRTKEFLWVGVVLAVGLLSVLLLLLAFR